MKGKRVLAMLLSVLLCAALLAGCGQSASSEKTEEKKEEAAPAEEKAEAEPAEEAAEEPAEEPAEEASSDVPVLKVAIRPDPNVTSYDDNYMTRWLEEQLGCKLEITLLPVDLDDCITSISLIATDPTADIPDVICGEAVFDTLAKQLGDSGFLLDWGKYRDDPNLMPNYCAFPDDVKASIENEMMEADGAIYDVPQYNYNFWNLSCFRWFIDAKWLEDLGLEVPTTTDELKDVLVAFKNSDPNGNGKPDEIPLTGIAGHDTYGRNSLYQLMNAFIFFNGFMQNNGLSLAEDGKTVIAPFATEQWREGLRYMKELYDLGCLSPDFFTNNDDSINAMLNSEDNVIGLLCSGTLSGWTNRDTNQNFLDMKLIAPFEGPEGVKYSLETTNVCLSFGAIVNTPNYELSLKFMDLLFSEEATLVAEYGEEGVDWSRDPADLEGCGNEFTEAGITDSVKILKIFDTWSEPQNKTWQNVTPAYYSKEFIEMEGVKDYQDNPSNLKVVNMTLNDEKYPYMMPNLHYTVEDTDKILETVTLIPDYVDQSMADFITGARSLDDDWDAYIDEMNNMGLADWLSIAQATYDAQAS